MMHKLCHLLAWCSNFLRICLPMNYIILAANIFILSMT